MTELESFIEKMNEKNVVIHYAQIYKNDKLIQEYNRIGTKTRLNVYSVSKSVTAIGVGIAIDEGLLRLEQKVSDFYPEYLGICPQITKITIRDLLTMTCGLKEQLFFSDDPERYIVKDWVDYFMKSEFAYEPGEHFEYCNFNTYILACIIEKVSSETLLSYMTSRFFNKIGIGNPDWLVCPKGHNTAANGLLLTIDEMSRIGRFLLKKGKWNGEQILSESFIEDATHNHITTNMPKAGYGYQFWINPDKNSYRADGKYGQYIVVLPEQQSVITMQALEGRKIFNDVWSELIVPYMNSQASY